MGGERFDQAIPESYLFGENADLNWLGAKPISVSVEIRRKSRYDPLKISSIILPVFSSHTSRRRYVFFVSLNETLVHILFFRRTPSQQRR